MNYYVLVPKDQPRSSWVMYEEGNPIEGRPRTTKLPRAIYDFFGPQPEGHLRLKAPYVSICCKTCNRYDDDAVFGVGFSEPVTIRFRGDFGHTQDRVMVISDRFLSVLRDKRVAGFETKSLGKSGWHALKVTERVGFDSNTLKLVPPFCPDCGRAKGTTGAFEYLGQIDVPPKSNTLFTTNIGWPSMLWDRDVFLTEEVVEALKVSGVKGGWCNRLWTDEEVRKAEDKAKKGITWKPPRSTVSL